MALMPVADALAAILAGADPLPEEMIALDAAYHRVLARDVAARRTQPPQAMSAMDGYAVRAADAADLSARLKVIGEVAAGRPFERKVGAGEAVRIFTGGVIPDGADAVIIQEDTGDRRRSHHHHRSRRSGPAYPRRRRRFPRGRRAAHARAPPHRPRFVARRRHELSGACGAPPPESRRARHRRRTGDAGRRPPAPARSSIPTATACGRWRAPRAPRSSISGSPPTRSPPPRKASAGRARLDADILITMGGASVGDHDLVKRSLEAEGTAMAFWRIAMRPGKPMMHGRLGAMRVIGLPGNPVSSYVCGFLFLVPLIRALSGRDTIHHVARKRRAGPRSRRQRPARRLSSGPPRSARRRHADRGAGEPPGLVAIGESRCGTGTCDTSAVRAGCRQGFALRAAAAAGMTP